MFLVTAAVQRRIKMCLMPIVLSCLIRSFILVIKNCGWNVKTRIVALVRGFHRLIVDPPIGTRTPVRVQMNRIEKWKTK